MRLRSFGIRVLFVFCANSLSAPVTLAAPSFVDRCNGPGPGDGLEQSYASPTALAGTRHPLTSRYVQVNEGAQAVCLHYVETGDSTQPLLVLLHGVPEFWYGWRKTIDGLADAGFHVVAPDLPGMNESSHPDGIEPFALEALARDVAELVSAAGYSNATIAGYDIGGAVAWSTAMFQPGIVSKLAIFDAPHPALWRRLLVDQRDPRQFDDSGYAFQWAFHGEAFSRAMTAIGTPGILISLKALAYRNPLNPDKVPTPANAVSDDDIQLYAEALSRPHAVRNVMRYYESILVREDHITEADVAGYVGDFELPDTLSSSINLIFGNLVDFGNVNRLEMAGIRAWERLTGVTPPDAGMSPGTPSRDYPVVTVPVLAVYGERDPYLDAQKFTDPAVLATVATNAQARILPGHTHWVLEEAPQDVVDALVGFAGN